MATRETPPPDAPPIIDRRTPPAGVLPRHIQAWSLLGLAGVMTAVLLLSGPTQPAGPKAPPNPALQTTDPSRARIEQYQRQIDEQARRLAAERAEIELTKEALRRSSQGESAPRDTGRPFGGDQTPPPTRVDPIGQERIQRDYRSLFVDSVVWSGRVVDRASALPATHPPTLAGTNPTERATATTTPGSVPAPPVSGAAPDASRYVLREGTVLDAVLLNRLDGQFVGPVNAMITGPAYSDDRQHVLIPAGSRLLGESRAVDHAGQSRLAVLFHRLLVAGGESVDLDQVRGLSQVGDSGLHDQVDNHYWQVFGSALAIGALGGLAQGFGGDTSGPEVYARGVSTTFGQSATHILDRFLNILPTVTVREGHRLRVYLSRDLALPSAERIAPAPLQEVP